MRSRKGPIDRKVISLVLTGGVVAISFSAIFVRLAQADPVVIAFYRMFFSALIFAPLAWGKLRGSEILSRQWLLMALAGLFLALHFLFWMTSLEHTSVASSVVLLTTQPLFVFLFSVLFLQERPSGSMWAGLFLALLGSVIIVFGQGSEGASRLGGNVLALLGAVMIACYFMVARKVRQTVPLSVYSLIVYGFSSIILALFILVRGLPWFGYSTGTWLLFLALALFPTALGHNSLNWALKYLPATMVSVVILGEPIGATLLAGLILREVPSWIEVLGGVLILIGIFLVWQIDQTNSEDPEGLIG